MTERLDKGEAAHERKTQKVGCGIAQRCLRGLLTPKTPRFAQFLFTFSGFFGKLVSKKADSSKDEQTKGGQTMRLKSALRRGVAAAVIAGIVVSSGIPAYAARWDIANGDITVKAGDAEGKNKVSQGETIDKDDTNTVITGDSLTVLRDMEADSVDMVITDPPYGIDYQSGRKEKASRLAKIANDKAPFIWWIYDAARVVKRGGGYSVLPAGTFSRYSSTRCVSLA
jgi:hypothetical protein